jgi:hypothetical protein
VPERSPRAGLTRRRPGRHSPPGDVSRQTSFQTLMRSKNRRQVPRFHPPSSPHPRPRRCQTPARQPPTKRHAHHRRQLDPQPLPLQFATPIHRFGHNGQYSRSSDRHSRSKRGRSIAGSTPSAGASFVLEPNVNPAEFQRKSRRGHICRVCVRLNFSPLTKPPAPARLEQDDDSPHTGPPHDLADAGARNSVSPGYFRVISTPKEILEQVSV